MSASKKSPLTDREKHMKPMQGEVDLKDLIKVAKSIAFQEKARFGTPKLK